MVLEVGMVSQMLESVDEKLVVCIGFEMHLPFHLGYLLPFEPYRREWKRKPCDGVKWI